jgi:hypothetical protein
MGPIAELIDSYQTRIATVEGLLLTAYQSVMSPPGGPCPLDEKRQQLKADLQKALARYCPTGNQDFDQLLERVLAGSAQKRAALDDERNRVGEQLTKYLGEHKQLADYLDRQLNGPARENSDGGALNVMIAIIRARYMDTGRRLFVSLREFQSHLEVYRQEEEELNVRLQMLVDRAERLTAEDLRQIEDIQADRERKADLGERREEVDRLLAHVRRQRLESQCN